MLRSARSLGNGCGVVRRSRRHVRKPGRPPEDRLKRQYEIFLAVAPLIERYGAKRLTMRQAARAAHLSLGGLYHYWKPKSPRWSSTLRRRCWRCGRGPLTAAKILGETAGVDRFRSRHAYARHTGTAPLPVWSSNRASHRLSRTGNRQRNAALHRIAMTQAHWHPEARARITDARCHRTGRRLTEEQGTPPPPAAAVHG
jgi:AcrR family transcriptional regulator